MRRREFLKYSGSSLAFTALGAPWSNALAQAGCPVGAPGAVVPFELRIGATTISMIDGQEFPFLSFNDRVPGPVLRVKKGRTVELTIHNDTPEFHSLEITDYGKWDIDPNSSVTARFEARNCGSYIYHSRVNDSPLYRLLGLHGAFIVYPDYDELRCTGQLVTPYDLVDFGESGSSIRKIFESLGTTDRFQSGNGSDGKWHPVEDSGQEYTATEFSFQEKVWVLTQVDPKFNALIQPDGRVPSKPSADEIIASWLPRYFTINGRSGFDLSHAPDIVPSNYIGEPTLMRIMNAGLSHHANHIHGNHWLELTVSDLVNRDGEPIFDEEGRAVAADTVPVGSGRVIPRTNVFEVDTLPMWPMQRKDVLLPFEVPPDIPYTRNSDGTFTPVQFNDMVRRGNNLEFRNATLKSRYEPFPLRFVMHCHVEMSTTAAGGNYPQGMVTHWQINGGLGQRQEDANRRRRTASL